MKTILRILVVALAVTLPATLNGQEKKAATDTVRFDTNIHCDNCVNTIMKSLPFEKGVKDVNCNLNTKVVTVEYNPEKTKPELLKRALEKLGYSAKEIKPKS